MQIFNNYILIFFISLTLTNCFSAGETVLRCYTKLHLDEKQTIELLELFWQKYPQNRVREQDVRVFEKSTPLNVKMVSFIDSSECDSCRCIFSITSVADNYKRTDWWIKSSNGTMIFQITIANKGEWTNRFTSDLCLKSVFFLDKPTDNFTNWQLTTDKKQLVKDVFEKDILIKLEKCRK